MNVLDESECLRAAVALLVVFATVSLLTRRDLIVSGVSKTVERSQPRTQELLC